MTVEGIRVSRRWLALREPADAAARAPDLVHSLRPYHPETGPRLIHDLGCGTGAMGRWLAPLLPGPQHWVVHDRDADLLEVAAALRAWLGDAEVRLTWRRAARERRDSLTEWSTTTSVLAGVLAEAAR